MTIFGSDMMDGPPPTRTGEAPTFDIFLAFSHDDGEFVKRMADALSARGVRVNVDWESGYPEGKERQTREIDRSRSVGFVVSPSSIVTVHWQNQLKIALRHRKKLFAITCRQLGRPDLLPPQLAALPPIDMTDDAEFAVGVEELMNRMSGQAPGPEHTEERSTSSAELTLILGDRGSLESVALTAEARRLLIVAARIGRAAGADFDITFWSILIAFRRSNDAVSQWFSNVLLKWPAVAESPAWTMNMPSPDFERAFNSVESLLTLPKPLRLTASAARILAEARRFGESSGLRLVRSISSAVDEVDIMAAYIYHPVGHQNEYEMAGLNRESWSREFLAFVNAFRHGELPYWRTRHYEAFRTEQMPSPETLDLSSTSMLSSGPQAHSAHITSDKWTIDDTLGYGIYAEAIAGFIRNPETKLPLTVSIQAPWGGGKTSLMRMVKCRLDPPPQEPTGPAITAQRTVGITLRDVLREIE